MHLYALAKASTVDTVLPSGIAHDLEWVVEGAIAAIVEPNLHLADLQQDNQALLEAMIAHDRIIRDVFEQTTILPLRFTSFASSSEIQADLRLHQSAYLQQLEYFAGKAEYTLKLQPIPLEESAPIESSLRGKDYFLAKKKHLEALNRQRSQQSEEAQHLMGAIMQHYPQHQIMPLNADSQTLHLLIDQAAEYNLQEDFLDWQATYQMWNLTLSERLPPYHFVSIQS
jgi:Gas vesicle synthesis protein GvpL/GvpF